MERYRELDVTTVKTRPQRNRCLSGVLVLPQVVDDSIKYADERKKKLEIPSWLKEANNSTLKLRINRTKGRNYTIETATFSVLGLWALTTGELNIRGDPWSAACIFPTLKEMRMISSRIPSPYNRRSKYTGSTTSSRSRPVNILFQGT